MQRGALALMVAILFVAPSATAGLAPGVPYGAWSREKLADVAAISRSAIVVDHQQAPVVLYVQLPGFLATIARPSFVGWVHEVIRSDSTMAKDALAIDPLGHVHTALSQRGTDALQYGTNLSGSWHFEEVPGARARLTEFDIALSPSGQPSILYLARTEDSVRYAYKDASGWHNEEIAAGGTFTNYGLTIDDQGVAHATYALVNPFMLMYATRTGANQWTSTPLVARCADPDIASRGMELQISCWHWDQGLLWARKTPSGWVTEVADADGENPLLPRQPFDHGWENSIAIDAQGQPHITYWVRWGAPDLLLPGQAHYATRTSQGWVVESVDRFGANVGHQPTIALDRHDVPHIASIVQNAGGAPGNAPPSNPVGDLWDIIYSTPLGLSATGSGPVHRPTLG